MCKVPFSLNIANRAIGNILNLEGTFLIVKGNGFATYQESQNCAIQYQFHIIDIQFSLFKLEK